MDEISSFVEKPFILEITSCIGCKVACKFCPKGVLVKAYNSEKRILSFEDFKLAIDKMPLECGIAFSGFAEPYLNPYINKMILYAFKSGRDVFLNTTLVGMTEKQFDEIKDIPFQQNILHLPDANGFAHIPITDDFQVTE